MTTRYVIESDGVAATPGMNRVIDLATNRIKTFDSRASARRYRDSIVPDMPSKDLPLVVRPLLTQED